MITLPGDARIWLVAGATDMRRGFDGLAALVQTQLDLNPFCGQLFIFRGRKGDRIKCLWYDGTGLCLFCKRLEDHQFVWPQISEGSVMLTRTQLSILIEGLDWRRTMHIPRPQVAV